VSMSSHRQRTRT